MKQRYLVIDVARCENCNNCLLACKDEHVGNDWPGYAAPQPDLGQRWMNIVTRERGAHPMMDVAYLPVPCQHCDEAPCIKSARDRAAYKRPDGIVIIDPVRAKGQKQLVNACPYGAVWWNLEQDAPQKCTLCAHLLDAGWEQPRCVQACPTGALTVRYAEEPDMEAIVKNEALEVLSPEWNTRPHVYYKNLYRFNRCFLGGSVAIRVNDREECAAGARVILSNASDEKLDEVLTDAYGEFRFDNLMKNSGRYTVTIALAGYEEKALTFEVKDSAFLGTIYLSPVSDTGS